MLEAVIRAFSRIPGRNRVQLKVFSGPFLPSGDFKRLTEIAGDRVTVARFTPDFLSYLTAADLSVSMGGYNTTMNILAAKVPALVWPFPQNREQRMRAERLAEAGALRVLDDQDLDADRLAGIMVQTVSLATRPIVSFDMDGAVNTAKWIENYLE